MHGHVNAVRAALRPIGGQAGRAGHAGDLLLEWQFVALLGWQLNCHPIFWWRMLVHTVGWRNCHPTAVARRNATMAIARAVAAEQASSGGLPNQAASAGAE